MMTLFNHAGCDVASKPKWMITSKSFIFKLKLITETSQAYGDCDGHCDSQ